MRAVRKALARRDWATATVEFAMTAPVLLIVVLGIADVTATTMAKFKSSNATQSGADLATQAINLQTSDMVNIFAGAADVMTPFSSSTLLLRITSVASDGNGSLFVHWSCGQGALSPYTAKSSFPTLPNGDPTANIMFPRNTTLGGYNYNGTNTTIIVVESQYTYTPPTRFIIQSIQTMVSSFVTYARQSAYVGFPWDGNVNDQPTAPASTTQTASVTLSNGAVCNYAY
jgi:Flp pilus assembly protein TadG